MTIISTKNRREVVLKLLICMFILLGAMICFTESTQAAARVRLSKTKATVYENNSFKLKLTGVRNNKVTWSVSNSKYVKISKKHKNVVAITVKGKNPGNVTVKAKYKGKIYSCKVTVKALYFNYKEINMGIKHPIKLTLNKTLKGATSKVTLLSNFSKATATSDKVYFAVEDPYIATISVKAGSSIKVVGYHPGKTTIKAKYKGKEYSVPITIGVQSYWNKELKNSKYSYNLIADANEGDDVVSFAYITDSHWRKNAGQSPYLINQLQKDLGFDFTVCGGDVLYGHTDTKQEAIDEIKDYYSRFEGNVFSVTGNHDTNEQSNENVNTYLSTDELYDLMYRNAESFANVSEYKNQGYIDDSEHKVRYIGFLYDSKHPVIANQTDTSDDLADDEVDDNLEDTEEGDVDAMGTEAQDSKELDDISSPETEGTAMDSLGKTSLFNNTDDSKSVYDADNETIDWVTTRIKELPEGWTVVLFSHAFWGYNNGNIKPNQRIKDKYIKAFLKCDEESKADIALWMVGHIHSDREMILKSADYSKEDFPLYGDETIVVTSTNADIYCRSSQYGGEVMSLGTSTEQAFELVQINTTKKKIYFTRVGAGDDRRYKY